VSAVWKRRLAITGIAIAISVPLLGLLIYKIHYREEWVIGLYGDDPRVLVWEGNPGYIPIAVWGQLRYDEQTKCLYLMTSSSKRRPEVFDRPVAVVWPKGSRPVKEDGRAGVRVGGFLGRLGGTTFFEGDILVGEGSGVGYVAQVTRKPDEDCHSGTLHVSFGVVERVERLPDWDVFDPAGPQPLYLEVPTSDLTVPVVRRWI